MSEPQVPLTAQEWLKEAERLVGNLAGAIREYGSAFPIRSPEHGPMLIIAASEEAVYVTKAQAMAFFGLLDPSTAGQPVAWALDDGEEIRVTAVDPQTGEGAYDGYRIMPLFTYPPAASEAVSGSAIPNHQGE